MKIRLAVLESDQGYLARIAAVFNVRYADKFEIYSFTDKDFALSTLDTSKIDVLVASDNFQIDVDALPRRCGFAYLVDSAEVTELNGQRAICKFQKVELIYKSILGIYSEKAGSMLGMRQDDANSRLAVFHSPAGGTGTSTMAAACALHAAAVGRKALYLNLEKYGSADIFFTADGQFDFSDVIYALKSRRTNLSMKLESCVKQDPRGVDFFSKPRVALDMLELRGEDILRLLGELKSAGTYDLIAVDMDFGMDKDALAVCRMADSIVWISDGSETANEKILRAYKALSIMEHDADVPLQNRIQMAYNRFSNKTGHLLDGVEIHSLGGAPRYAHMPAAAVVEQLSKLAMFDAMM